MNRDDYLALLKSHDDPFYWECPSTKVYDATEKRFLDFAAELGKRLNRTLETETGTDIQDASFHSQLLIDDVWLRFSNFGDMIAISDDSISHSSLQLLMQLAVEHGYIFVPLEVLGEPYTGQNPGVTGIESWWIRYFDWV